MFRGSPSTLSQVIREGDVVLLYQDARRKWVTKVSGVRFHTHKGFVELGQVIGKRYGDSLRTSMGSSLFVFKPRALDMVESFERPTQILYPKDVGYALYQLGVKSGDRVVEVGTGSGAMTASLAHAVAPSGQVFSYEARTDFLEKAKENVAKTRLSPLVTFHNRDPSCGFEETEVDAVVLDLGDPWTMVRPSWQVLVGGGMLAGFTPTVNQLERLAESLRQEGFLIVEAVEVLLRQLKTETGKLRPESRMIGHTAYVTIARKIMVQEEN